MNTTPIAFMAWDSDTNYIYSMEKFKYYEGAETQNEKISKFCDFYYGCELLQLTSLRSISGEPIYNHMIVKNGIGSHYVVDMFDYTIMFILSNENLEIVGNRFQNHELLELCK